MAMVYCPPREYSECIAHMLVDEGGHVSMDTARNAFRKNVYERLEQQEPRRWERLRGRTVTHREFGEGIVTKVMMPDWSNPVHLAIKFRLQEETFHLSSFRAHTKLTALGLPAQLAELRENAEHAIARDEG